MTWSPQKGKILGPYVIIDTIDDKLPGYFQYMYWHTLILHTDEVSFQEIRYKMMKNLIEDIYSSNFIK